MRTITQSELRITGAAKALEAGEYRIRKTLAKIPGQEDNVGDICVETMKYRYGTDTRSMSRGSV